MRPSRQGDGSELGYLSHTDPHGKLPVWLVNKITQIYAPKVSKIIIFTSSIKEIVGKLYSKLIFLFFFTVANTLYKIFMLSYEI